MTTPIIKIYPSASLEEDDLEQRIEKKLNHAKRFNNSSNKIEGKNPKSKKKHKNYKNPNSILKTGEDYCYYWSKIDFHKFVCYRFWVAVSAGIACGLSLGTKILYEIVMKKYSEYKKQYEKKINKLLNVSIIYTKKNLQDNIIDRNDYDLFLIRSLSVWMKRKMNLFCKNEH